MITSKAKLNSSWNFLFALQAHSGLLCSKKYQKMMIISFEANSTTSYNCTFLRHLEHCFQFYFLFIAQMFALIIAHFLYEVSGWNKICMENTRNKWKWDRHFLANVIETTKFSFKSAISWSDVSGSTKCIKMIRHLIDLNS